MTKNERLKQARRAAIVRRWHKRRMSVVNWEGGITFLDNNLSRKENMTIETDRYAKALALRKAEGRPNWPEVRPKTATIVSAD